MSIPLPYMIRKLYESPRNREENDREYDKYQIHC